MENANALIGKMAISHNGLRSNDMILRNQQVFGIYRCMNFLRISARVVVAMDLATIRTLEKSRQKKMNKTNIKAIWAGNIIENSICFGHKFQRPRGKKFSFDQFLLLLLLRILSLSTFRSKNVDGLKMFIETFHFGTRRFDLFMVFLWPMLLSPIQTCQKEWNFSPLAFHSTNQTKTTTTTTTNMKNETIWLFERSEKSQCDWIPSDTGISGYVFINIS